MAIGLILLVLAFPAWRYVIKPELQRLQKWEGVIADMYIKTHRTGRWSTDTTYYFKVDREDGSTVDIMVPRSLYVVAHRGNEVYKKKGERWPHVRNVEESPGYEYLKDSLPKY